MVKVQSLTNHEEALKCATNQIVEKYKNFGVTFRFTLESNRTPLLFSAIVWYNPTQTDSLCKPRYQASFIGRDE